MRTEKNDFEQYYFRMRTIGAFSLAAARLCAGVMLSFPLISASVVRCQTQEDSWTTTIRGVVLDSETRKPIPQAVVYVDRDPPEPKIGGFRRSTEGEDRGQQQTTGADGRFVFSGLDFRPHFFSAGKEGYISATNKPRYAGESTRLFSSYEVHAGPDMGEIRLFLTPAAKIQGRVESEAGAAMKNVLVTLYSGVVEDGRTMWLRNTVLATDGNGFYSFTNLAPGVYMVLTDWIFDNDPDPPHGTDCGSTRFAPTAGYPPAAYPGALDFSGAQPIHLAAGHVESADFRLQHREFHSVTWIHNSDMTHANFSSLRNSNGRNLRMVPPPESHCGRSMPVTADLATGRETIHLPDGEYTLLTGSGVAKNGDDVKFRGPRLGVFAHFVVTGRPLTLSYPQVPARWDPAVMTRMQVDMAPDGVPCGGSVSSAFSGSEYDDGKPSLHTLWLTRADPLPVYERAIPLSRSLDNKDVFYSLEPGKYWVHAVEPGESGPFSPQTNTYIASVTAGGVDMAKEPLVVGLDGTAPPLEVTARYHCGILHLKYGPAHPYQERYGIVRSFYGFLVPQFSAFETVHSFLFEPGRPQEITVGNLTPGHYKFYVSSRERGFAFRESTNAPSDLGPGEDVWLKPGERVDVAVAEPAEE